MIPSPEPLDHLLGMHYMVLAAGLDVEVPEPREKSFIVVEDPVILPGGDYIYAVVKQGVSTPRMVYTLARRLRVRTSCITVAGLKDARATALQYASVKKSCLENPPRVIRGPGFTAIMRGRGRVARGLVAGNRFAVRLCGPEAIEAGRLLSGRVLRLPAYYGYQRFGTRRPNTHVVGLLLAYDAEWLAALEAIDEPYPDENPRIILSRILLKPSIDPERGMARRVERLGVLRLSGVTPHGLMQLYFSALQAFIFNEYLSERIRQGYPLDERIDGEGRDEQGRPLAPVPGVDACGSTRGEARRLLEAVLARHGLELDSLRLFRRFGVAARTFTRPVYIDVSVDASVKDDCAWLVFRLEKGMYASLILREVCKNIHKCVY